MARWLRRVRLSNEMEQDEFGLIIGKSRSTVNMMERGERTVRPEVIAAIMTELPDTPLPPTGDVVPTGSMLSAPSAIRWELPYAGTVPCSGDWGDPLEGTELRPVDPDFTGSGRYICRVAGMSCYPALMEGDMTIWEEDRDPAPGVIVLAQRTADSACTVKQLQWSDSNSRYTLVPVNREFEAPPDDDGWEVVARLVGVIRKVNGIKRTWLNDEGLRPSHLVATE